MNEFYGVETLTHVRSDESVDDKTVSIDNPASLIALLESENTGKENLTVTINFQSDGFFL